MLTQVYGRVEGGWPLAILDSADHALLVTRPDLIRSFGRPIAEVDARLRPLGDGDGATGELVVRSAMTPATTPTPKAGVRSATSFAHAEGYLTYERRLDRMINTGYHVYPEEIEAVIARVDGVARTRVVGEPHPRWGETLIAYVVPRGSVSERELAATFRDAVAARLAHYKVPREFRLVPELPLG